ncbi:MAG: hypothetical protein QHH12_06635 [Candidatus Bathyarchaeota archaeon]|nr:hypothetical protein [Candidatus Bathyarchaeota archaeon A05DMB-3]MDH7607418.1 hypothetical protein [Candidatus Bathyarchaeota archaeon]
MGEKVAKHSGEEFSFRVKFGDYEVEVRGSRGDVLEAIKELPNLMSNLGKAFENLKPETVATVTVKAPVTTVKGESPVEKYPKIPKVESCGEAVLKVLESDWGKWRPRTIVELKEALAVNNLRFPGRNLAGELLGLVRKGVVRRWKTDKGHVYILAEEEVLTQ